jgi:hypothetical protein
MAKIIIIIEDENPGNNQHFISPAPLPDDLPYVPFQPHPWYIGTPAYQPPWEYFRITC